MKNMIAITILLILFCCFIPRNSFGTMLPLEVIEITPQHHHLQQQQQQQQQQEHFTQVYNNISSSSSSPSYSSSAASTSPSSSSSSSSTAPSESGVSLNSSWNSLLLLNSNNNNNNNNNDNNSNRNSIEGEGNSNHIGISINSNLNSGSSSSSLKSDSISNSNNNNNINININNNNNGNSNTNNNDNNNKHKSVHNHHSERRRSRQMLDILQHRDRPSSYPETRILYQVGDSEEDLPICAPNAVCSKIDLYETPWIERQCRCPEASSPIRSQIIIHHNKDRLIYDPNYKHYFESEKALQHRKLQNFDEKKVENFHLKRLMHKLDAVYQDDIMLDENDFIRDNEEINSNNNSPFNIHKNDYNMELQKGLHMRQHEISKLRHSGHHREFPQIGGCPSSLGADDGHTITDKTRHYKLCNPIHKLPICRYFRDYIWTLSSSPEMNVTEQIVHCRCPKNSIIYLTKREPLSSGHPGYKYLFACSPQSRLRCQRKEPCKLFTLRKRQQFLDEVNTNPLCQCPKGYRCPKHHTDVGVIAGKTFIEDNIQTYSGYCMAND